MSANQNFKAKDTTIGELLNKDSIVYTVSRFQRPYAWGIKQQEELLKDLVNAIVNVDNEYSTGSFFMGNFIFQPYNSSESNKTMNIVDGQQRLITIMMILVIIRNNLFLISENKKIKGDIRSKAIDLKEKISELIYLSVNGLDKPIVCPHENQEKKYFFENILFLNKIKVHEIKPPENSFCKNYYDGYKMLQDNIENYMERKKAIDKVNFLEILYSQIRDSAVVSLTISNENLAYNIYSNINSKGLYLSPIDLIKNDFLYKTNKINNIPGVDKQFEAWEKLYNNVKYNSTIPFDVYYKYCWYIVHPEDIEEYFESDTSIFEMFQTKYPNEKKGDDINKFFKKLTNLSEIIIDFKNTSNVNEWKRAKWSPSMEKLGFANEISRDTVTNNYTLWLLPLYDKCKKDQKYYKALKDSIPFVTDTVFIYKLLLERGSENNYLLKLLEEFFDEIFKKFATFEIYGNTSIIPIIDKLKLERANIIGDARNNIMSIISSLKYSESEYYIRYILRRLNDDKSVVLGNFKGSIEHIIEAQQRNNASDSIGNLVYLETSLNEEAAAEKNELMNEYKRTELINECTTTELYKKILTQKFEKTYIQSKYPEVENLITTHSPIDFDEEAVKERSNSIAKDFLEDFINI
ncbi:MAG: DUF262 domain-containing protein [Bacilli bacterium]